MTTIKSQIITLHNTFEQAAAKAKANQEMDGDWTYSVFENAAHKFIVQIFDEDGLFVGTL